jgi:four helix bundle protein
LKESPLKGKSYSFAIRIVKLCRYLNTEKKEFLLSKQLFRSGTEIGALVREAEFGQSKADFINKLIIALKEANETLYWLNLLKDTEYIENKLFISLEEDCKELVKILVSSVKTLKKNGKQD